MLFLSSYFKFPENVGVDGNGRISSHVSLSFFIALLIFFVFFDSLDFSSHFFFHSPSFALSANSNFQ